MKKFLSNRLKVFVSLLATMHLATWLVLGYISEEPIVSDIVNHIGLYSGVGLGATLTVYVCYLWLLKVSKNATNVTLPVTIAVIATVMSLPYTMTFGSVLGGTMAAGFVSLFLQSVLGISSRALLELGTWLGEGLGSFIMAVLPTLLATTLGYSVGRMLQKLTKSTK